MEAQKLETIAKDKAKIEVAAFKVQEEKETFSRITKDKLRRSLEVTKENREAQIKALQDRLRDHVRCFVTFVFISHVFGFTCCMLVSIVV